MKKHFDVFIQPELDKMRVILANGNPARMADDVELLQEHHRRLAQESSYRVKVNCYEDFLTGKQEQPEKIPF